MIDFLDLEFKCSFLVISPVYEKNDLRSNEISYILSNVRNEHA